MNIQALKSEIGKVMPLLVANRDAAYQEWMDGSLPRGAFEHVQSRIDTAHAVLVRDDIDPLASYRACAFVTIDIRSAVEDVKTSDASEALDAWIKCYRAAGFTGTNPIFNVPALEDQIVLM